MRSFLAVFTVFGVSFSVAAATVINGQILRQSGNGEFRKLSQIPPLRWMTIPLTPTICMLLTRARTSRCSNQTGARSAHRKVPFSLAPCWPTTLSFCGSLSGIRIGTVIFDAPPSLASPPFRTRWGPRIFWPTPASMTSAPNCAGWKKAVRSGVTQSTQTDCGAFGPAVHPVM